MIKIVIDQGRANFMLSDLAVLRLYLMGSKHVKVLKHDIENLPSNVCTTSSLRHAAKMLSLKAILQASRQDTDDGNDEQATDHLPWMRDCDDNSQSLERKLREHGNTAVTGDRLYLFGMGTCPPVEGNEWRADPLLVQVIEELGDDASVEGCSDLCVIEIPSGVEWRVVSDLFQPEFVTERSDGIPRQWSVPHLMPPVYGEDSGENPYVLESDMAAEERRYARAMGFLDTCPVPDGMKCGDSAFYLWDYKRWYYWQMAQGDAWREKARGEFWYCYV